MCLSRPFVRKLINKFDYEALDIKMLKAKVGNSLDDQGRVFLSCLIGIILSHGG